MLTLLAAMAYSGLIMDAGLRISSVLLPRKDWILTNVGLWEVGWWLWLLAIFGWMLLLVTLMWRYTPAHRVATMLQSGLIIISAVLAILGTIAWMKLLPIAMSQPGDSGELVSTFVALVDTWATSLLASGCFMGGIVTAWIGIDLIRLKKLPWSWLMPAGVVGLLMVSAPISFPSLYLLIPAGLIWLGWCLFLSTRRDEPRPFPELL